LGSTGKRGRDIRARVAGDVMSWRWQESAVLFWLNLVGTVALFVFGHWVLGIWSIFALFEYEERVSRG